MKIVVNFTLKKTNNKHLNSYIVTDFERLLDAYDFKIIL